MKNINSISNLSKKAVFILKEVSQDSEGMISYTVSGGIVSLKTGGKNLISDSSGRTPEIWELAFSELVSAKLINSIGYPDIYKITPKGYRLADMLNDDSNLFLNMGKEMSSKRIFISYRRDDSAETAGRIYDRLVQSFEKGSIFKDVDSLPAGFDFRDVLDDALRKCDVFLAIIGVQWLEIRNPDGRRRIDDPRDFVRIEIESALERNIPVIPVLVQGASMPSASELPLAIRDLKYRQALLVRPDPDFHTDMDRLIRNL